MAGFNETVSEAVTMKGLGDSRTYIIAIAVIAIGLLLNRIWSSRSADPKEPALIPPKIPFIGHLLGMAMDQAQYLAVLSKKLDLPIFRINVFGGQLYVVSSPELTQAIFRHSKTFSFDPIQSHGSKRILDLDQRQVGLLAAPIPGVEGSFPLSTLTNKAMHKALASGPNSPILLMNQRALNRFAQFINPIDEKGLQVDMFDWFNESFTVATSVGAYGPDSPLEDDRSLVAHLNHYEESLGLLMINKFPSITAPKGHAGRKAHTAAFSEYYRKGGDQKTTGLVSARREVLGGGGFTTDDLAQFDIGIMLAASMNSNPALFWLVSFIYSDEEVLQAIRDEVASAVRVNGKEACIDISQLLKDCPILVSSMQEMLRLMDATVSFRTVMEDTLLDGKYLLKKDGVIQIICETMHTSSHIWGPDALQFDARRFLKSTQEKLSKESRKQRRDGYTPFGGGASLCPGRHFVTMEILGVVATLVVGYDITMRDGSTLKMPRAKKQAFGVQVKHVEKDIAVNITRRKEWLGKEWTYDVGTGEVEGASGLAFSSAVGHEGHEAGK